MYGTIHLRRRRVLGGRGQKLRKFADVLNGWSHTCLHLGLQKQKNHVNNARFFFSKFVIATLQSLILLFWNHAYTANVLSAESTDESLRTKSESNTQYF